MGEKKKRQMQKKLKPVEKVNRMKLKTEMFKRVEIKT